MNDKGIAEYEAGWLAACEHKQREIDELTARVAKLEGGLRDVIRYADDCMKLLGEVNDAILKGDEDDEDDEQRKQTRPVLME